MSLHDQIVAAIGAHGMWKSRLHTAIEHGRTEFSVAAVQQDNQCEFGKWLSGPDLPPAIKRSSHFVQCRDLHRQFHLTAAKVLSLGLANKKAEALQAMDPKGEFAVCSAALTKAMMDWDKAGAT